VSGDIVCCPLGGGEDGPSCSTTKVRTARKEHRCTECREVITAGTKYDKPKKPRKRRAKKGAPASP